ncbi:hypothetical protein F5J12DRAFT_928651 [Pisolithus orientalis]|uniref:uncharacterized protein n=1 Tax=Pisolithus orientalis TaxID=936130 RepID=UPI002225B1CD|nr:uncharacterized protein F5J12DRAFT_928651 [Pisolithus orientalis]KAI5999815.1 hypothetical protein F5J12DRAFT_928651 [Pisolithus orientalis]
MSTVPEEELQFVYDTLYQIRLVNYVTRNETGSHPIDAIPFIWRYYHNADEPYEYVPWHHRLRRMLIQGLFIFGRYYGLFYLILFYRPIASQFTTTRASLYLCRGFYYYTIFGGEILYTTLVNVILTIRLNVLFRIFYGMEGLRKYQFFLAGVVIIEYLVELIIGIFSAIWVRDQVIEPPAGVPWPGCLLSGTVSNALVLPSWITAILVASWSFLLSMAHWGSYAFVAILFGCTLHLLFSNMRWRLKSFRDFTISNIKEEIKSLQPTSLLLISDGFLFYIPMVVLLVTSVAVNSVYYNFLALVTSPLVIALYSFCSSRFIIHTRETIAKSTNRWQVEDLDLSALSDPC